jgi:hypothetical protein
MTKQPGAVVAVCQWLKSNAATQSFATFLKALRWPPKSDVAATLLEFAAAANPDDRLRSYMADALVCHARALGRGADVGRPPNTPLGAITYLALGARPPAQFIAECVLMIDEGVDFSPILSLFAGYFAKAKSLAEFVPLLPNILTIISERLVKLLDEDVGNMATILQLFFAADGDAVVSHIARYCTGGRVSAVLAAALT